MLMSSNTFFFRDYIFPRLIEFGADMIFLSAGFDAHKKDTINSGYISLVGGSRYMNVL